MPPGQKRRGSWAYGGVTSRGAGQKELGGGGNDKWGIFFLFSVIKVILCLLTNTKQRKVQWDSPPLSPAPFPEQSVD